MGKLLQSGSYPTEIYVGGVGGPPSSGIKVYFESEQVWPATNYWDCGYGCQYYVSDPSCAQCYPTATNVLHSLFIGTNNLTLDYYVTLSNNYGPSSKTYKLRFTNTSTGQGPIETTTMTVNPYSIDVFFNGTTSVFGAINNVSDSVYVELHNGTSWSALITVSLNYTSPP